MPAGQPAVPNNRSMRNLESFFSSLSYTNSAVALCVCMSLMLDARLHFSVTMRSSDILRSMNRQQTQSTESELFVTALSSKSKLQLSLTKNKGAGQERGQLAVCFLEAEAHEAQKKLSVRAWGGLVFSNVSEYVIIDQIKKESSPSAEL